jgi:hypothetical protein
MVPLAPTSMSHSSSDSPDIEFLIDCLLDNLRQNGGTERGKGVLRKLRDNPDEVSDQDLEALHDWLSCEHDVWSLSLHGHYYSAEDKIQIAELRDYVKSLMD